MSKSRIYPDLINSFRFYLMLSIALVDTGCDENKANKSFMEFKKDVKDSGDYSEEVIQANITASYETFPSGFLKLYDLPSVRDDIKIQEY